MGQATTVTSQSPRVHDGHLIKQKLLGQAGMASEPLTAATSDLGETA